MQCFLKRAIILSLPDENFGGHVKTAMSRPLRCTRGVVVFVTAYAWIATASAADVVSVQINFSPVTVTPVPLSSWLIALIGIGLVASGAWLLRHRKVSQFGRLGAWLVAGVCAATLIAVVGPVSLVSEAWAVVGTSYSVTLISSPAVVDISLADDGNAFITATNGLSVPVAINGVALINPIVGQQILVSGTTCVANKILEPGSSCTVEVLGGV
jgi:hypothetical protein